MIKKKKRFSLKRAPKEIAVKLDYPYIPMDEAPTHYFPRVSREQAREIAEALIGMDGLNRETLSDETKFEWWKKVVLEKTRDEYEDLTEKWKEELWADPEGHWHILHAVDGYLAIMYPRSFLSRSLSA